MIKRIVYLNNESVKYLGMEEFLAMLEDEETEVRWHKDEE